MLETALQGKDVSLQPRPPSRFPTLSNESTCFDIMGDSLRPINGENGEYNTQFKPEDGVDVCRMKIDENITDYRRILQIEKRKCFAKVGNQATVPDVRRLKNRALTKRFALILRGGGFRSGVTGKPGFSEKNSYEVQRAIYLSHKYNIINVFKKFGYEVSVFISSWEPLHLTNRSAHDLLKEWYKPLATEFHRFDDWPVPYPKNIQRGEDFNKALRLSRNAYSAISLVKTVFNYSAFDLFCLVRLDTLVTDNIFQYTGINDIHRMRSMLFWSENIQLFGTIAIPCLLHLFIKGCITMYPADYGTFCGPSSYSCKGLSGNHILHFKTLQQFFWRDGKMFYPPVDFREEAKSAGIKRDAGRGWMYTLRERGGDVVSEYAKNFPANLWDLIPQHKANETKIHFNHRQEL